MHWWSFVLLVLRMLIGVWFLWVGLMLLHFLFNRRFERLCYGWIRFRKLFFYKYWFRLQKISNILIQFVFFYVDWHSFEAIPLYRVDFFFVKRRNNQNCLKSISFESTTLRLFGMIWIYFISLEMCSTNIPLKWTMLEYQEQAAPVALVDCS